MLWELLSIIVPSIKSIDKNDMMQIVNTNTLGKFPKKKLSKNGHRILNSSFWKLWKWYICFELLCWRKMNQTNRRICMVSQLVSVSNPWNEKVFQFKLFKIVPTQFFIQSAMLMKDRFSFFLFYDFEVVQVVLNTGIGWPMIAHLSIFSKIHIIKTRERWYRVTRFDNHV